MTQQRIRLYALLAACTLISGAIDVLLARHLAPGKFAAVAALWAVVGALAWWKWSRSERKADIRRWFEYRWWRVRRLPLGVLGVLVGMAIVSSVAGFWGTEQGRKGLWQNLGPELGGAVVTYVLIDLVLRTRQREEALLSQMGLNVRDVAVPAVDALRREGWLSNGSLRGAELWRANLEEADLMGANLEGVDLELANLEGVIIVVANLEGCDLGGANLKNAWLADANLKRADLRDANLEGVNLWHANLEGAELVASQLSEAWILAGVTLPDGTKLSEDNWRAEFEEWRREQ